MHWMIANNEAEETNNEETCKNEKQKTRTVIQILYRSTLLTYLWTYHKKISRWIRIPLVWIIVNLQLALKAADTMPSGQEWPWKNHNMSESLDTSLFLGSCTVYIIITVLLCLLFGTHTYNLLKYKVNGDHRLHWIIVLAIVLYYLFLFFENISRNIMLFIWFSHTEETNFTQPLLIGLSIPVSGGMMLVPFLIMKGIYLKINQQQEEKERETELREIKEKEVLSLQEQEQQKKEQQEKEQRKNIQNNCMTIAIILSLLLSIAFHLTTLIIIPVYHRSVYCLST